LKQFIILFTVFSCITVTAQNISGVVYNATSKVEDIKIENLATRQSTFSNKNGAFTISAKAKDTLKVSAIFYITQLIVVKPIYETEPFVIQLKKTNNTLEEVSINGNQKEKVANIIEINTSLRNQILEDIKRNPHLYGKAPSVNIDFIKIIGLIGKLFKNKNKAEPFKPIVYQDLVSLFSGTNKLFNDALLIETLNIDLENKFLFFELCEAKSINSKLLEDKNELELLENIITIGNEFTTIIANFKKNKTD